MSSVYRYLWAAAIVGALSGLPQAASADAGPPHIVLVLVDDMGYGDPGCYNSASKIPTPHIDALAHGGMRFTDAHASGPLCHVSRYGLLTGRHPFRTKVGQWRDRPTIAADRTTLAALLQGVGYRTAMVGKWHLGFAENGYDQPLPGGPVDRGFDSFFGIRASTDIPPYFYIRDDRAVAPPTEQIAANSSPGWSPIQGAFWRAGGIAPDMRLEDVSPRFADEAVQVIKRHAATGVTDKPLQPLLLYLALPSPHTPWLPTKEFAGKSQVGMYGDFVMLVDDLLGQVLAALDETQMAEDTLVVFTSDNGPVWYEADVERFGHDSAGPWRGMKADAWEAGHRMPFMVRWPGRVPAGSVSNQLICFTDLMATLASIVGAELAADDAPDSLAFADVLTGAREDSDPVRKSLVVPSGGGAMTIRMGDWKLINRLGSGGFSQPRRVKPAPGDPPGQLYNLADDPGETNNLYGSRSELVAQLQEEMKRVVNAERTRP